MTTTARPVSVISSLGAIAASSSSANEDRSALSKPGASPGSEDDAALWSKGGRKGTVRSSLFEPKVVKVRAVDARMVKGFSDTHTTKRGSSTGSGKRNIEMGPMRTQEYGLVT
jgi:hypothetical protein